MAVTGYGVDQRGKCTVRLVPPEGRTEVVRGLTRSAALDRALREFDRRVWRQVIVEHVADTVPLFYADSDTPVGNWPIMP